MLDWMQNEAMLIMWIEQLYSDKDMNDLMKRSFDLYKKSSMIERIRTMGKPLRQKRTTMTSRCVMMDDITFDEMKRNETCWKFADFFLNLKSKVLFVFLRSRHSVRKKTTFFLPSIRTFVTIIIVYFFVIDNQHHHIWWQIEFALRWFISTTT